MLSEEKEVELPLAIRTRVKTKVESSFSQVPVSSSVHGSLGSSGRTHSKQKRLGDPVEREKDKASFLLLSFMLQFVVIILFELMSDHLFFFLCSPSVSQTPRKAEANHLVKMWYGFSLFVLSVVCFSSTSLALFTCDVLMLIVCAAVSLFFFLRRKFLLL